MAYIREYFHPLPPPPLPGVSTLTGKTDYSILDRLSLMEGFAYKRQLHMEF